MFVQAIPKKESMLV